MTIIRPPVSSYRHTQYGMSHQSAAHTDNAHPSGRARNGREGKGNRRPTVLQDSSIFRTRAVYQNLVAIHSSGPGTSISSARIHLVGSWSDVTGRTPPPGTASCQIAYATLGTLLPRAGPARNLPTEPPDLPYTMYRGRRPRRRWQGWDQAWIPGGRLAPLCLAMPPCRDLCNVGIGIDYGDCVVACWALSRDFTTVLQYSTSSTTLFRNKLRRGPFGLLLLACLA